MQQVNGTRKSDHGSNHYFDLYLQVSEEGNQMIRVMTAGMDDTAKHQLFRDKKHAQQPITLTNLRVASSGVVFMHNNTVVKDVPTMSVRFSYVPPAALPVTSIADVIKSKKQGDTVTVSGTVKWNGEAKTPTNSKRKVRDGKLIDSSGAIDISVWEDHIAQIKEKEFFQISNCKVKHFYGKKLSTSHETIIKAAEQQNITEVNLNKAASNPRICCPEIENAHIDTQAMCNTKGCRTKITEITEAKKMVRCTSCNRAMLVENCYLEMTTTFQLDKDGKKYTVVANQNIISNLLNEDIFLYKDNVDDLILKLLMLEKVDFELSSNGRMITQIVNHQEKLDEATEQV